MAKIKEVVKTMCRSSLWDGGVEGFQTNLTVGEGVQLACAHKLVRMDS